MSKFNHRVPVTPAPALTQRDLTRAFYTQFEVINAETPALLDQVYALRYQIYCVENPFENPADHPRGRERDAFDDRAVHALVRHRASGLCAGTLRLVLPDPARPDAPFPIETHCDEVLQRSLEGWIGGLPRQRVAEISRFAVSKEFRRRLGEQESVSGLSEAACYTDNPPEPPGHTRVLPYITIGLFLALFRLSLRHGITHWLAVMEPSLLRLLQRFAVRFERIGPVIDYHGRRQPAVAVIACVERSVRDTRPEIWDLATDFGRFTTTN